MLKRKSAGYSLVELMVAIGVLAVVTVPIIMLYQFGTRMAAAAHRQTIAAVLAQQRVEELIGLPLGASGDGSGDGTLWGEYNSQDDYNTALNAFFYVALKGNEPAPAYVSDFGQFASEGFLNDLAEVTVLVYESKADANNALALGYDTNTGAPAPVAEQTVVISLAEPTP